jgi:transglutaminase-like putative cysteine protease
MRIAVTHVTRLEFGDEVSESVMDTRLGPRDDADQRVERFSVRMEPAGHVRRYQDGFGNIAHLLTNMRPHAFLQVSAHSEVETFMADPFQFAPRPPGPLDVIHLADCLDPSPLVPRLPVVAEMAAPFRANTTDNPFEAVRQMTELIHRDFAYQAGVTDVTTSIEEIVAGRQGVCQDFAHLLLGMCRAIEIPARYVSGYIVEHGDADARTPSRGVGASHAWVEVFTPTHGWRGFDPTNNLLANEYYVKIAIGRDYSDVPPTRGTYHGGPTEQMTVAVTAHALD